MPQTSYIIIFLLIGFVVYVTIKGELPNYVQAIYGGSTSSTQQTGS